MNSSLLSRNSSSLLITTTLANRGTTSRIPYREQVLIDAFNTYIQIGIGSVLFLFGLTFNSLSLLYFRASRSFRHTTFQLYFSIIAILDTIRLFEFFIFILFDKGYLHVTLILCRWVFFTIMFTGQASIWLTVALAVEKCIIIWFPIKGRLCFTILISKVVLIIVLCLVFFADVIYLLPNFFLHTYENVAIHTFMCVWQVGGTPKSKFDQWKKHYFTFNTIFFHSIIPSILLLVINWLLLCSLSRQRIVLSKMASIDARHVLKREKQFKEKTIQLILSSFFVIFTISPRYILTMVNAFAANISKTPLMPLYIYVNLNTVFRVLEMSNYSLNLMFAIMSGRTSRREIRKLLWECFLWRFHRTKTGRQGSRIHTHSSLFDDDDDDTERSIATTGASQYCVLTSQPLARSHHIARRSSHGNTSFQSPTHRTSLLTCCGITVDLSQKHSSSSCNGGGVGGGASGGDPSSRHSTLGKCSMHYPYTNPIMPITNQYYYSPRKRRTYSQSPMSLSSFDRHLEQQPKSSISSASAKDSNRALTRRRTTTAIHCFRHLPASTLGSISNKSTRFHPESKVIASSISKENDSSADSMLQTQTLDSHSNNIIDIDLPDKNSAEDMIQSSSTTVQNTLDETHILPAYIVETC